MEPWYSHCCHPATPMSLSLQKLHPSLPTILEHHLPAAGASSVQAGMLCARQPFVRTPNKPRAQPQGRHSCVAHGFRDFSPFVCFTLNPWAAIMGGARGRGVTSGQTENEEKNTDGAREKSVPSRQPQWLTHPSDAILYTTDHRRSNHSLGPKFWKCHYRHCRGKFLNSIKLIIRINHHML